jgi:hypothetical protein
MDTTPYLWRNLDGRVVVSSLLPVPHLPNNYSMAHRPATAQDLATLSFLKPEQDTHNNYNHKL